MNLITKLQIRYSLTGSIVVPIIGCIVLAGTAHAGDLHRYIIPALVGCVAGFLIGRVQGRYIIKQRELAESKRYLKAILDNIPAPIYLKDSAGKYLLINRQYEMLVHIPMKEIIGKNDFDVFPEHVATLFRSQDEKVKNCNISVEFEETIPLKDGEHTFITFKFPLYDANRNIYAVGGFYTDITIRKQAEEELKRSKNFSTKMLNNSPNPIICINPDTSIGYVNPSLERLTDFISEELVGTEAPYPFWPKGKEIQKDLKLAMLKDDMVCEETFQKKGGERFWVEITSVSITHKGKLDYYLASWVDVTERKRAEEEKKKIETLFREVQKTEAIGTLAGGIAHDFNNLLMIIQGTASLMLFDVDSTHPHYERLQIITKQVQRGASLTAQLLGYASKGRYEVKPISLNQIVEETSDIFGMTHKEITIHIELTEDLSSIEADQSQIEQVLLNLYINASEAMPRGGTLTLKTVNVTYNHIKDLAHNPRSGSYALLTVTDTGTGMDKDVRERIFEPFFTTKQMGRGTGLGMASSHGIIKGHRGYIHVNSKKGRGTTFSIYLPASDKEVVTAIKPAGHVIEGSGTILLVDDEDQVLDTSVMMLEKTGYTVLKAKGGREAVEVYEANEDKIDLVILDMIMPDLGGGKAYDKIKVINPDVKVLLSSGYSSEGEVTEILDRGCDGFIQKPFNINELSEKIRELLDTG
ncbi:MAG: PAS domain S-box protein [Deltaproteobacteria bacterium]|nr:PAS domain S-box protein [Deltaproteobacteria bacterium]MBW2660457.1 PAS domain S-box protein [Deltaproteobacteria bacterium]